MFLHHFGFWSAKPRLSKYHNGVVSSLPLNRRMKRRVRRLVSSQLTAA